MVVHPLEVELGEIVDFAADCSCHQVSISGGSAVQSVCKDKQSDLIGYCSRCVRVVICSARSWTNSGIESRGGGEIQYRN